MIENKMEIKMNPKMKEILNESKHKNIAILQENFSELLFPEFDEEYDCITLVNDNGIKTERSEEEFLTFVKETYADKTGYEASVTDTGIVEVFFDGIPLLIRSSVENIRMRTWSEVQIKYQDKFIFRNV